MTENIEDRADALYLVPTHLGESQAVGPIPVRTFFVALAVGLFACVPIAALARHQLGDVGAWLAIVPLVLAMPFAMPWLNPPAEHGALKLLAFLLRNARRNLMWIRIPPRAELAEADGLHAFVRVLLAYRRGDVLVLSEQPDLVEIRVEPGVVYVPVGRRRVVRAIYRAPTLNLDMASGQTRRAARARWGSVLNALPHPIQIVVHAAPSTSLTAIDRVREHGRTHPPARELANWLDAHHMGAQLVERERYVVVPGDNPEQLADRCAGLESSMRRIGLPIERIEPPEELKSVLAAFLSPRRRRGRMLPRVVDPRSPDHLLVEGEYVRAFDLGKLPPTIATDWLMPLLDGDLPLDVSIDVEPLDLAWAKLQLDTRRNALESSPQTPGRTVALEQIAGLRMAYERRTTLPVRLTITLAVRAQSLSFLEKHTVRVRQRVKDLGAELDLLKWEQREGWLAAAPLRRNALPKRGLPVETGTAARTYPFSSGTLAIDGGVPFGVAAAAPVTFTTAATANKNRHMCWYGTSGAGKGYSLRVLLSRERFANGLRVYGIDQDEQQEYAGRFCDYLGGSRIPIHSVDAAEAFDFGACSNADVVIWDLHESDEGDRARIFATLKAKLVAHLLMDTRRAAFIVDEAVTVTEEEIGARALGDLVRRGRHWGLEVHILTQRVTDWFDTRIGRTIQSVAASKWFGQLESRELHEIAVSLALSDEERDRIERAGQGEGLLVTAGRRVWVNLYGHTSPGEYSMAHTDPGRDGVDAMTGVHGKQIQKNVAR